MTQSEGRGVVVASGALDAPTLRTKPAQQVVEVGRSVAGVPIEMTVFGRAGERVLIVAGTHGDEPGGATLAVDLERYLHAYPELVAGCTVAVLTRVNPDGLLSGRRTNASGVDLNRNYPSRDWCPAYEPQTSHGPYAASEPETRAVMRAVELLQPDRIIDIHSIRRDHHCNEYDGPAGRWAELMSQFNGYPVRADIGYGTPGALGSWAGFDLGIPTITLELPGDLDRRQSWRDNAAALLAFIGAEPYLLTR